MGVFFYWPAKFIFFRKQTFSSLLQIVVAYSLLPFLTDNFTWKIMDKRKLVTIIKWPFSKCKPDSLWIPAFSLYRYIVLYILKFYIFRTLNVTNIVYEYVIEFRFCWLHLTCFASKTTIMEMNIRLTSAHFSYRR